MPFIVAAALKSAQGSSTVALVATSALVAPMLGDIGLASDMGRVLTVMAIGAGAMTVSHANDSFFWVVTQFSRMSVKQAYKAQTMATLVQGDRHDTCLFTQPRSTLKPVMAVMMPTRIMAAINSGCSP